jgi:hypothetical protein
MTIKLENISRNLSTTERKADPDTIKVIEEIIFATEIYFEGNMDESGIFLNIPFAPRLFESLLLGSYINRYYPEKNETIKTMIEKVTDEVLMTSESGLDVNIQYQLLILYNALEINMVHWLKLFTGLLREAFDIDTVENYQRKLLIFLISSLFISINNENAFNFLLQKIQEIMLGYQKGKEIKKDLTNNWNVIYPFLVKMFITQDTDEQKQLTKRVLNLQSPNGSFFQNHTTTLIVLHVLKFLNIEKLHEEFKKRITLTEVYILKYSDEGLSILPSMNHYNTILLYSLKALLTRQIPFNRLCVDKLLYLQNSDGGWGVIENTSSDFDMTSLTVLFLHKFHKIFGGQDIEEAINRSLTNYYQAVRKKNGSFVTYIGSNDSLTEMTARGILIATVLSNHFSIENTFEIVKEGLIWLNRQQNDEGYFNDQSYSYSKLYPLTQVALSIHFVKESKNNLYADNEIRYLVNNLEQRMFLFLMNMQNADGSFGATFKTKYISEQQSTIYSLITLSLLNHQSIQHKLTFNYFINNLLDSDNVIRKSYPEGTGPRPIRYNDLSHGSLFSLVAMYSLIKVLKSNEI